MTRPANPICSFALAAALLLATAACRNGDPAVNRGPTGGAARHTAVSTIAAAPTTTVATGALTNGPNPSSSTTATQGAEVDFVAEVWADNWFSLYANGVLVGQDSVPITTERSFNAETIAFTARYPLTLAIVAKDYIENDSGLEYIGTGRQQMGDGGFIAQITERTSGRLVTATGADWRGLVIHRAPTNPSCEKSPDPVKDCQAEIQAEPVGWTSAGFDDGAWTPATSYTAQEVGTKDGYDTIRWNAAAALIWSTDLKADNTVLWRSPISLGPR